MATETGKCTWTNRKWSFPRNILTSRDVTERWCPGCLLLQACTKIRKRNIEQSLLNWKYNLNLKPIWVKSPTGRNGTDSSPYEGLVQYGVLETLLSSGSSRTEPRIVSARASMWILFEKNVAKRRAHVHRNRDRDVTWEMTNCLGKQFNTQPASSLLFIVGANKLRAEQSKDNDFSLCAAL
jgi:hypothetical protein